VLLCQGKVSYELADRRADAATDVAILRLEQCAPFPAEEVLAELERFPNAETVWVQEEPENMGAGRFVLRHLRDGVGRPARLVARPASPSPATGSLTLHRAQQSELIERAFTDSSTGAG
jgi:2-oxoglutarate dehydrogenase complex dehydrogenase (E1) component-like enzyme